MYYVETKLVFRVEHEENASQLEWVREAIDGYLEGEEEVVYVKSESITNEGVKEQECECGIDDQGKWSDTVFDRFGCDCENEGVKQ